MRPQLFVAGKEHGQPVRCGVPEAFARQRFEDGRDGALGVGAAQAVQAVAAPDKHEWIRAVAGVRRHGVDVRVENQRRACAPKRAKVE
jgi:hypothetical protein